MRLWQHSRTRNYVAAVSTGYVVMLVNAVVGLWLTPFTLRFLDREAYGVFALGSEIVNWLWLLDFGIAAGLRVHLAQMTGKPDPEAINRYCSSTFFAQMLVVAAALALGTVLALVFPSFFAVRPDLRQESLLMMILLVVGSAAGLAAQTFSAILVAHQQIHIDNLIRLLLVAVRTGLTVVLLLRGWGLLSLAASNLVATALVSLLAVARSRSAVAGLTIRWRLVSWDVLKTIGTTGIWFSLGGLAGLVILSLDRTVAGKLLSLEAVTVLTLTSTLYRQGMILLESTVNSARPALGQLFGAARTDAADEAYRQLANITTGLAIVGSLAIWSGNGTFIRTWVGHRNYGGWMLDTALASNLIIHAWILPNRAVLASGLVVRPQTLSRLVEGGANLSLSIWLTQAFGLVGTACSTTIGALATSFWYLPRLVARMFHRPFARQMEQTGLRPLVLFVSLAPAAWLIRSAVAGLPGFAGALLSMLLTGCVGLLLTWFLLVDRPLIRRLRGLMPIGASE